MMVSYLVELSIEDNNSDEANVLIGLQFFEKKEAFRTYNTLTKFIPHKENLRLTISLCKDFHPKKIVKDYIFTAV